MMGLMPLQLIEMIKYPLDYNPIQEYWEQIESGKEIVSKKIYKTYKKVASDLKDNNSPYYYSHSRANHIIEFIENFCRHSKGKMGGKPIKLELWEKALLATVFGFIDAAGYRKYREALLIVGKKNGKSLIGSCVGLYLQIADSEPGPEVYAVATKRDQAKIIWLEAKRMVRKSPALIKRIKPLVAELSSEYFNDGIFKPLASDSNTMDGLNVHGCLMDEIHQWKNGKALFDIMADGVSAREQPLIFMTSTAGTIREDIYDQKYEEAERVINGYFDENGYKDDSFIAFIYELDKREEWTDPKCWKKANPGLGTIKNLGTLKRKVDKARENPKLVKNLVCKEFNIRETSTDSWLNFDDINNTTSYNIEEHKDVYAIGGVDLSSTTDLTCATLMWETEKNLFVNQMYFIPREMAEKKEKEDKVPYKLWEELGFLTFTEGAKVDYTEVTKWFVKMRDDYKILPLWIGYDNWNAQYFTTDMQNHNFVMERVIQGAKTMSPAMKQLEAEFKSKNIIYNNNPVTKWNLTNTQVKTDDNNNIRPIKGKNTKQRIDGTVSLIDAFVIYMRHYDDYRNLI